MNTVDVVEGEYTQPNKYISVESGVKLLDGGKVLQSGAPLKGLVEYKSLEDPFT